MAIRKYKPTTPGRRGSSVADFAELTRSTPEKSLLVPKPKTGGRITGNTPLELSGTVKTYRYLDEEETAKQEEAAGAKKGAPAAKQGGA